MENTDKQIAENQKKHSKLLTAMFANRESTEKAYDILHQRGYTKDEINLVMSEDTRLQYYSDDKKGSEIGGLAAADIGTSSAIGGTIGVVAGVVIALATGLLIPGAGILLAGPIAVGLAAGGAGGVTGGIIGALVGSGIAEDHAKLYENGVKNGQVVIGVHPRSEEDAEYFEKAWGEDKAADIYRQS